MAATFGTATHCRARGGLFAPRPRNHGPSVNRYPRLHRYRFEDLTPAASKGGNPTTTIRLRGRRSFGAVPKLQRSSHLVGPRLQSCLIKQPPLGMTLVFNPGSGLERERSPHSCLPPRRSLPADPDSILRWSPHFCRDQFPGV